MLTANQFDRRQYDRRVFAVVAVLFLLIVFIGFSRSYYLKPIVGAPPLPSGLVHFHGLSMTLWVLLFVVQTWLIRTKRAGLHMKLGWAGAVLGLFIIVSGFMTGVAAGKFGSAVTPPGITPIAFMIVPVVDMLLFGLFFGTAIRLRKRAADHKRLMLLTVLNFLPPALGRFPFDFVLSLGPVVFFGIPSLLAIAFLVYDRRKTGTFNRWYAAGAALLVVSYPARLMLSETEAWTRFAIWLTTWAA